MSNKISVYPDGGAIQPTDKFVIARAGLNKSILGSQIGSGGGAGINYLINGGFDFAKRLIAPGTLTTIADKSWGADRWQQFAENASWQYNQNDATGETGLTSKYYGLFKKITNTGKGIFVQKVEGINSVPLRGKTIVFQIKMKASANKTIRIGILELQNAGTIDTFPAALASAFGANTVDPTWGANVAVITAAASCAVLAASWTSFSISVTVPANSKNVVAAIWTDSQFAANDTLSVAEAGLFVASSVQAWTPRLIREENELCLPYCFPIAQGSNSFIGNCYYSTVTQVDALIPFPVTMRIIPTLVATSGVGYYTAVSAGGGNDTLNSLSAEQYTLEGTVHVYNNAQAAGVAGQAGYLMTGNAAAFAYFEAEIP